MNIYLDYAATTPIDPRVNKSVYNWTNLNFGNPSSLHRHGQKSKIKIEEVRDTIAVRLTCLSKEIIFTSGGTEANNSAIIGSAFSAKEKGNHIIVTGVEHPSVIGAVKYLQKFGFQITYLNPDSNGVVSVENFIDKITDRTILVSAMYVNNETGIILPVPEIGKLCKERGILFHCDAVQAYGKMATNVNELNVDLMTLSAHKIYGPKGIGALYIREGVHPEPRVYGGSQEANKRPGTENLSGIIGLGEATNLMQNYNEQWKKVNQLKKIFEDGIKAQIKSFQIIGEHSLRSPYISSVSFLGIDNQSFLLSADMEKLSVSVGSACSSGSIKQSQVLEAMELSPEIISSAVRFSFGRFTTEDEIRKSLQIILKIVNKLRK